MRLFIGLILILLCPQVLAAPHRLISTMPSITETLFALGLSHEVVGVTQNCNWPPEAAEKDKIGRETVNLEKIISLKPDLIIMLEDAQKKDIEKLRKFNLPVYTVNPHSVYEVLESIYQIGSIAGVTPEAEKLVREMTRKMAQAALLYDIRFKVPVFVVVGYKPLISVGRETFINDVINLAGGYNIAENTPSPYPQYNFEELIKQDPPVIIIPENLISKEEMQKDIRWGRLRAVKNDRILFINPDILFRPGPRVVQAIEIIAGFIHQ